LAGFDNWNKKGDVLERNYEKSNLALNPKVHNSRLKQCASAGIHVAFKDRNKSRIIYSISWWVIYITLFLTAKIEALKSSILKNNLVHRKSELNIRKYHSKKSLMHQGIHYWRYYILEFSRTFFRHSLHNVSILNGEKTQITTTSSDLLKHELNERSELSKPSKENDIAVIGYITAETGLGESVRGIIRSLDRANLASDLYDIRRHYARTMDEEFSGRICDVSVPTTKYKTCLIHVNADQVPHILEEMPGSLLEFAERRIGYWYWETEMLPYGQEAASNYFDEIWVATEFVRDALISSGVRIPVLVIPPALSALPDVLLGRRHFNLPEDRQICLSVFDATSFLGRKNPIAVIQSLKQLYIENEIKPLLLLKTTNLKDADREELVRLAWPVDVHIINKYLSRDETLSLIALADCFISLHRAEGLGLSLIDAMRLGTPLVSTDYSGPKDFANDDNASLVPWEYCQARWEDGPYYGSAWAEPNIKAAARQILGVMKKGEVVRNRIVRAKQKVEEHFSRERIANLIEKRL
jgi:glycosyltransferase involved in cell wall biosynthesis